MNQKITIKDIIENAVQSEIDAYEFYQAVAEKMTDSSIKEIFSSLAAEEQEHREFLKRCLNDLNLLTKLPTPPDYKVAESLGEPDLSLEMKPADAIALAMKKEQAAYELYTHLAESAADSTYKETFSGLAKMELSHKTRLEDLFVNVGYPEVF